MINPPGKFAGMVKIGEKGQIVIPKEARELLGVGPGIRSLSCATGNRGWQS